MDNRELIKKAIAFSNQHYDDSQLNVETVAAYAGFSMDYFNKIFLIYTGFHVMAYVNYIRVKEARRLLKTSRKSVLDIALSVGYESHEGFTKAFKRVYGITPTEYRKNAGTIAYWGEMADETCLHGFLHDNPDFQLLDADDVIDCLLTQNLHRYGFLCTEIQPMGLWLVAPDGNFEKGFLTLCDDHEGGLWMEAYTDDMQLLGDWLRRFHGLKTFTSSVKPAVVAKALKEQGLNFEPDVTPLSVYIAEDGQKKSDLPREVTVRKLTPGDTHAIARWAKGKKDGYIRHLLTEAHYADPGVLEYGVFQGGDMIAAVGCGIQECHGFVLNNCIQIRFGEGMEQPAWYQPLFEYVVQELVSQGVLPFDDLQQGEYAQNHGGFTADDVGFCVVGFRYRLGEHKKY